MDFIKIQKAARCNSGPEVFIPMDGTEYSDESLPPISAELKLDEAAANVNDVNPSFLPQTGSDVAREWARASTASSIASAEIRTFQMGLLVIEIWPFVGVCAVLYDFFPYTAIVALSFVRTPLSRPRSTRWNGCLQLSSRSKCGRFSTEAPLGIGSWSLLQSGNSALFPTAVEDSVGGETRRISAVIAGYEFALIPIEIRVFLKHFLRILQFFYGIFLLNFFSMFFFYSLILYPSF